MTHHKKIVIDLNSLSAKESLNPRGHFCLKLASALAQAASNSDFELYIVVKSCEQSSNVWLRDHFAGLMPRQNILSWSTPAELNGVSDEVDLTLRLVSEHIRESVIGQINPDLVIVTNLWCGWQDQSCASVGLMGDCVPTAVCLPSSKVLRYNDVNGAQVSQQWFQTKLLQLKRAQYWLDIIGISDPTCVQQYSLPTKNVLELAVADVDDYSKSVLAIVNLAEQGRNFKNKKNNSKQRRPRLAFVSPLPPEHTGIASYSSELLPELAKYYDVDVIVDQDAVDGAWINANAGIYSIAWFSKHGHEFDRILYQIGNAPFHAHMWDLLERFPGVIVLHDIFLGDATYYRSEHGSEPLLGLPMRLYADHGYAALAKFALTKDIQAAIQDYPYSLSLIQTALGVVVHSQHAKKLAALRYNVQLTERFSVIPHLRVLPPVGDKLTARTTLGVDQDVFLVCSFGHIVSNKMYVELLEAWLASPLAIDKNCLLVLVGTSRGEYGSALETLIGKSGYGERIKITGWADEATFKAYLNAADLAVQLRKDSRGESSGSVLDCMAVGLTTICNAHGSMAELPADSVWKLEDEFTQVELIDALTTLWREPDKRQQLGRIARQTVQRSFAPWHCAELYHESIEAFYGQPTQARRSVVESLASKLSNLPDLILIADALERSVPNTRSDRQLLVDITALMNTDLQTGIQRVVRSVLKCLLESPPKGFRVEPVYTSFGAQGYFYARQFTKQFLQIDIDILADGPVLMLSEDIFLGLDLCLSDVYEQRNWFDQAQQRGALVYFVVYDLLPVTHPHWFPITEQPIFQKWLETIIEFDGAISISNATSDALRDWIKENPRRREKAFRFGVAHIGADIEDSMPTNDMPADAPQLLQKMKDHVTFLIVGTIEPRKGHAQVLEAFELLWQEGHQCQLVIVGKPGWNVEHLVTKLTDHEEQGQRLFWLKGINDAYLSLIYQNASCLLAASEGEGFGLPLIEAARHGLPILARDIAVFREVGRSSAAYFSARYGWELKLAVERWLTSYNKNQHPIPHQLTISTWTDCTENISLFLANKCKLSVRNL